MRQPERAAFSFCAALYSRGENSPWRPHALAVSTRSFDSAGASLCEAPTALRMTMWRAPSGPLFFRPTWGGRCAEGA